jgi:beta-glucanase (GH16 family)
MDWLPDRITWYVDGVERFETTDKAVIPTKPMHPTIQLDQGPKANWMDGPDDSTPAEVKLQVDWFRISKAP